MRRLLVVLALAASWAVVGAAPAAACSCAGTTDRAAFAAADAVFVGVLHEREVTRADLDVSTARATHRFLVDDVYKGDVAAEQEIVSRARGESCGLELAVGSRALVFATRESWAGMTPGPGQYWADLCNGTRLMAADEGAPSLGPGSSPLPASATASADDVPAGHLPDGEGSPWLPASTLAVAASIAAASWFVIRGRRGPRPVDGDCAASSSATREA